MFKKEVIFTHMSLWLSNAWKSIQISVQRKYTISQYLTQKTFLNTKTRAFATRCQ